MIELYLGHHTNCLQNLFTPVEITDTPRETKLAIIRVIFIVLRWLVVSLSYSFHLLFLISCFPVWFYIRFLRIIPFVLHIPFLSILTRPLTVANTDFFTLWNLPLPLEASFIGKCKSIRHMIPLWDKVYVKQNRWFARKTGTHMLHTSMANENRVQWDFYQFHEYDVHHPTFPNWIFVH